MLNHVTLQGRLTRDAELKSTANGISTCRFTLAVDRNYQSGTQKADFISCVAWRQTAEFIAKYFKKGDMLVLEGSIQTRVWEDAAGRKIHDTDVIADRVHFCGKRREASTDGPGSYAQGTEPSGGYGLGEPIVPLGTEDDLPF